MSVDKTFAMLHRALRQGVRGPMKRLRRWLRERVEATRWGGLYSFQPYVTPYSHICPDCDRPRRLHSNECYKED